jgi:hypothetical protein
MVQSLEGRQSVQPPDIARPASTTVDRLIVAPPKSTTSTITILRHRCLYAASARRLGIDSE